MVTIMEVEPLTREEAEAMVDRVHNSVQTIIELVPKLYAGLAWHALGFDSWEALCAQRFGGIRFPVSDRRAIVKALSDHEMTAPAISAAIGVPTETVRQDRTRSRSNSVTSVTVNDHETERPGANRWSRQVQKISGTCPIDKLTDDELAELHGAATFLRDYCKGEQIRRRARS
jgi:hypothetical protein